MKQWQKMVLELGPLAAFFLANWQGGLFVGTGAYIVATAIALPIAWVLERKLPVMPLVTGVFVIAFGGLTLALEDELFIKIKPTLVNALFATALFTAYFLRRNILRVVFGSAIEMDDQGWRVLTVRWACFFVFLAGLNEVIWRNFDTDFWVNFKVFGIFPLTLVFGALQLPLIMRHQLPEQAEDQASSS